MDKCAATVVAENLYVGHNGSSKAGFTVAREKLGRRSTTGSTGNTGQLWSTIGGRSMNLSTRVETGYWLLPRRWRQGRRNFRQARVGAFEFERVMVRVPAVAAPVTVPLGAKVLIALFEKLRTAAGVSAF